MATPVSLPIFEQVGVNQRSPAQAKIACSVLCFADERMFIRNASRAVRQAELVTRQLAAMSGSREFARNRELSAPNVRTNAFFR